MRPVLRSVMVVQWRLSYQVCQALLWLIYHERETELPRTTKARVLHDTPFSHPEALSISISISISIQRAILPDVQPI